ncbi:MAG: hypothetical protein COB12_05220 [Flavobacterium sp.]|nr:MAG: hypothetical protein COB12_05220 [Flavobacterium sp.]
MLLYLIIPFDEYFRALPNILMAILVIAFPFVVKKSDFKKLLAKPLLVLVLFFVYLLVNSFFQGNIIQDIGIINKMMIPIGLVLLYLPISDFKKLKKAIVFSSFISIVFTLVQFIILINNDAEVSFLFFQETVDALLIDRVYIGLLCVLSILISYKSLTKKYHPDNVYFLASIIISVLYILLIMSKTAIILLVALIILRQFYGPKIKTRLLVTLFTLLIFSVFGYFNYQDTFQNNINSKNNISEIKYNESYMPLGYRTIIWDCAINISENSSDKIFGIGFKETSNQLVDCYKNEISDPITKHNFISKKFNTHNQYADFYISSGLISLILFLLVLIYLIIKYHKQFFPTALLITIVLFGMVENFFHRQVGAYYFGFILVMLLINQLKETNNTIKEPKDNLTP